MRRLALCLVLGVCFGCGANREHEAARASSRASALQASQAEDAAAKLSARLAPRLARSSANLTEVVHPDGRRSLRVNGGFSQAQMARVDASGQVATECVDTLPAAERAMRPIDAEGAP